MAADHHRLHLLEITQQCVAQILAVRRTDDGDRQIAPIVAAAIEQAYRSGMNVAKTVSPDSLPPPE
ncbi:MAG: hypothetical protein KIT73_07755 [Burkholderiales bacterium]|nr:hypothetical protein [Burkholderiales bacterium]